MEKVRGMVIVPKGMEDVAAREVEEILKAKATINEMCVEFEAKDAIELCRLCYVSQSASRVLFLLDETKITERLEECKQIIAPRLEKLKLSEWVGPETRFKVECKREGKHDFTSQSLAEWLAGEVGKRIKAESGKVPKADLKEPNLIYYALVVQDRFYLGVDLAGFEVSKRDYKVMSHMPSIKGNIGYALLRIAGYEPKQALLDPNTYSGIVCIEAALMSAGKPVNYYRKNEMHFTKFPNLPAEDIEKMFGAADKKIKEESKGSITCMSSQFRYISSAKSNSKIAGVNKLIDFSRFDVEWLDTKFGKNAVDVIASNSPRVSTTNGQIVEKYYNELFYQANFILKKKGVVGLLCNSLELIKGVAEKKGFRLREERVLWQGEEELFLAIFEKAKLD